MMIKYKKPGPGVACVWEDVSSSVEYGVVLEDSHNGAHGALDDTPEHLQQQHFRAT